jgi:hypothetical protein
MRPTRLLAATIALGLAARADASVLCGRRNGDELADGASVKVRSACKSNELPVDAAALGLAGAPGLVTTVVRTGSPITTNGTVSTPANCADGEVATGGGALSAAVSGGLPVLRSSRPEPETAAGTPTGWRVTVVNSAGTGMITVTPFVVCAVP